MTPSEFKPAFRIDVGVVSLLLGFDNQPVFTPINPMYCATDQCAKDFAALLVDLKPQIVQDFPFPNWPQGNLYYQTAKVPYFLFPDGTKINVGVEASFFTHNYPANFALDAVRNDILMTQKAAADAAQNE